ncbi:MAG: c-type cytochrome, partial [Steroidobacteraceae bacterium]|nr:c-type cytochrome [Steroidobacteraceae bacterium]MDW8258160.1 c-type cytochrome [Gammaproteobacteria bacterium]
RTGVMPPLGDALGSTGVENVVAYVLSLSGHKVPVGDVAAGAASFAQLCAACHGADGRGNPALGAPNLTDHIWVYGGSANAVREAIVRGRQNQMPAHGARLGEQRVKLVTAYLLALRRQADDDDVAR